MTKAEAKEKYLRWLDEATRKGIATPEDKRGDYNDKFNMFLDDAVLFIASQIKIAKTHTVVREPVKSLLETAAGTQRQVNPGDPITMEAAGAKSAYFEMRGRGAALIKRNGELVERVESTGDEWTEYRCIIPAGGGVVSVTFAGEYTFFIRNVALFDVLYSENAADVPAYQPWVAYQMPEDFSELSRVSREWNPRRCELYSGYRMEGINTILIPYADRGTFVIEYWANPPRIPVGAPDDTVIGLAAKALPLVPLLVAQYATAADNPSLSAWFKGLFDNQIANLMTDEVQQPDGIETIFAM